jgi:hypothetical protein
MQTCRTSGDPNMESLNMTSLDTTKTAATQPDPISGDNGKASPDSYLLRCTLQFLTSTKNLTKMASKLGRENGMDDDWVPEYFDRAILELLLYCEGNPTSVGLKVCPSAERMHGDVYTLNVKTYLLQSPEDLRSHLAMELMGSEDASLDDLLTIALMSSKSPVDLGFEIVDTIKPESGHEEMATTHRAQSARV